MKATPPVCAALIAALSGCASLPEAAEPGPGRATAGASTDALVPTGHGSLRQDDFTVQLRSGPLLIKVTPLAEEVIRLAAPDTYQRLHALARQHRGEDAGSGETAPALFLVSFFSYEPDVAYEPEALQLEHRGAVLQPRSILPLSPGFGRQRLDQQEARSAVYLFASDVDLALPLAVRYELERSDGWDRIVSRLESERARVRSRAGG